MTRYTRLDYTVSYAHPRNRTVRYVKHGMIGLAIGIAFFLLVILLTTTGSSKEDTKGNETETDTLVAADGAYNVSWWTTKSETITLHIEGRTLGWVGFGVSGTGGMKNADIMVAWVDDSGEGHILDTHAKENGAPIVDSASQDWKLLESSEDGDVTRVTVQRYLRLCDSDNRNITSGTTHIIWAMGDKDPASLTSLSAADYHGNSQRGTAARRMLDPPGPPAKLPGDAFKVDVLQDKFQIPAEGTTYWCRTVQLQELPVKHHMVMVEPVLDTASGSFVHHIVLYLCKNLPEKYLSQDGFECYATTNADRQRFCSSIIAAWAVGGEDFYYPPNVGLPMGGPNSPRQLMIEMHYNNPQKLSDVMDSSGLRIWLTPSPRQYDAGVLNTGVLVNNMQIIPPRDETFTSAGHCSESCFRKGFDDVTDRVYVFGGFLHTHLAGVSVVVRHIRNGTELPPILQDTSYDYNYQNVIFLDKTVTLLAGDRLIVDCGYSTTDRKNVTYGGLTIENEMCLAFLYHYPPLGVSQCLTYPSAPQSVSFIQGAQLYFNHTTYQYYFTAPPAYAGQTVQGVLTHLLEKDPSSAAKLQAVIRDGGVKEYCEFDGLFTNEDKNIPKVERPYIEPEEKCN